MAKDKTPETQDKPESAGFLSGIDAKLAALKELRDSYIRAVSVGAIGDIDFGTLGGSSVAVSGRTTDQPVDLPNGAFLNKSMPEAIKLLFVATKRKYQPAEVATILKDGGYESTSKNFEGTVSGTMYRMKDQGTLLRFKDGFGLAEFYPEHLRAKIAEASKPSTKGRGKKATKGASKRTKAAGKPAAKATPKAVATPTATKRKPRGPNDGPSTDEVILKILASEGPNSPATFVMRLDKPSNVIALALGRLAKLGKAERLANGNYAATNAEPVLRAV